MLQSLRQFRRHLAGTFGSLVTGVWLALALAPCAASADMANNMAMEEHCPHCDHASSPCAEAVPDCGQPASLGPVEPERFEPVKLLALPVEFAFPDRVRTTGPPGPAPRALDPPHPPFTKIFCRYQE